jgi:hypothetical protein
MEEQEKQKITSGLENIIRKAMKDFDMTAMDMMVALYYNGASRMENIQDLIGKETFAHDYVKKQIRGENDDYTFSIFLFITTLLVKDNQKLLEERARQIFKEAKEKGEL